MRKSLRLKTAKESVAGIKDLQKQIFTRTAQRKFAINVSSTPELKELSYSHCSDCVPETKDFINFLCLRDSSHLPSNLENFTNPPASNNENSIIMDEKKLAITREALDVFASDCKKRRIERIDNEQLSVQDVTNIIAFEPPTEDLADFFIYIQNLCKFSLVCIKPSSDWKALSYIQESLQFELKTSHVHRLKFPNCKSFLTLQCLRKCFEKGGLSKMKIPCIGLCEVDLPHLMEVVASFGGVDSVNSDQSWRALAEQLNIPKSASRRATQLEDIYMEYILPYVLLPEEEQASIMKLVENEAKSQLSKNYIYNKRVCLETFHRMSCNANFYYGRDSTAYEIEEQFWEIVIEGNR